MITRRETYVSRTEALGPAARVAHRGALKPWSARAQCSGSNGGVNEGMRVGVILKPFNESPTQHSAMLVERRNQLAQKTALVNGCWNAELDACPGRRINAAAIGIEPFESNSLDGSLKPDSSDPLSRWFKPLFGTGKAQNSSCERFGIRPLVAEQKLETSFKGGRIQKVWPVQAPASLGTGFRRNCPRKYWMTSCRREHLLWVDVDIPKHRLLACTDENATRPFLLMFGVAQFFEDLRKEYAARVVVKIVTEAYRTSQGCAAREGFFEKERACPNELMCAQCRLLVHLVGNEHHGIKDEICSRKVSNGVSRADVVGLVEDLRLYVVDGFRIVSVQAFQTEPPELAAKSQHIEEGDEPSSEDLHSQSWLTNRPEQARQVRATERHWASAPSIMVTCMRCFHLPLFSAVAAVPVDDRPAAN